MGESWRSGGDSGLDGLAEKTTIPNEFRESSWRLRGFEFGAHSGRVSYDDRPFLSFFSRLRMQGTLAGGWMFLASGLGITISYSN